MTYLFYKNNAEKNGTFHMQIMLKDGDKHARISCDTCSKLSIWAQKQRHIFHFEQLSVILVVSLLLTFNKYAASGVLSFSVLHFYALKYNKENDKRFNNREYSLFFLMGIFLKHL